MDFRAFLFPSAATSLRARSLHRSIAGSVPETSTVVSPRIYSRLTLVSAIIRSAERFIAGVKPTTRTNKCAIGSALFRYKYVWARGAARCGGHTTAGTNDGRFIIRGENERSDRICGDLERKDREQMSVLGHARCTFRRHSLPFSSSRIIKVINSVFFFLFTLIMQVGIGID